MRISRFILVFATLLTSLPGLAFNPAHSNECKAWTQQLLQKAASTDNANLIRIEPAKNAKVIANGKTTTLRQAILKAPANSTLLLGKGTYLLPESAAEGQYTGLYIKNKNLSLIGATENPDDVIIDSDYRDLGKTAGIISVGGANAVIANLTVKRSIFHLVHLWKGADNILVHNVHLIDGGQQFLKASPGKSFIEGGTVRCSQFLMTDTGRDNVWGYGKPRGWTTCYTGGIDTHHSYNWIVKNNRFEGIYCNADGIERPAHQKKAEHRGNKNYKGGLSEHAVHLWHSKEGTNHTIANNQIIDCARGIGIGLRDKVYGGIIKNNMILSRHPSSREHDVGIALYKAIGTKIVNNTVYYSHPSSYQNAIEIMHKESKDVLVANNLTNIKITLRKGANARLVKNETGARKQWFTDAESGDLHLTRCVYQPQLIGQGYDVAEVTHDIDGTDRGKALDIGADECDEAL